MTQTAADPALIDLVNRLADASGAVVRRHFRAPFTVEQKADASPVTVADRGAEAAIRGILEAERPGDGIVGEEYGSHRPDAAHVWVIDPIDGTKSFITGRPIFGTLIALLRDGVPVLGVIDQPILGDRWIGGAGHPTTLNGEAARVRRCAALARAVIATTTPAMFDAGDWPRFQRLERESAAAVYGGDCFAYAGLASGWCDLVVESGLNLYDFAALVPVIEAAGGIMTDWRGQPLTQGSPGQVVAAGDPAIHRQAMEILTAS
ncbi:MAG: histidinol-phosphatase [Azospirillaceae bacterium]